MKKTFVTLLLLATMTVMPALNKLTAKSFTRCNLGEKLTGKQLPVNEKIERAETIFKLPCYLIMDI